MFYFQDVIGVLRCRIEAYVDVEPTCLTDLILCLAASASYSQQKDSQHVFVLGIDHMWICIL